jgi:hypothetical protein
MTRSENLLAVIAGEWLSGTWMIPADRRPDRAVAFEG